MAAEASGEYFFERSLTSLHAVIYRINYRGKGGETFSLIPSLRLPASRAGVMSFANMFAKEAKK